MKTDSLRGFCSAAIIALCLTGWTSDVTAQAQTVTTDAVITEVYVNGGADTVNAGTTCIRLSTPPAAQCPNGVIAIPNNNRQLVAAAMMNKASASRVWLYYQTNANPALHCPGIAFTPCGLISIGAL